MTTRNHNGEGHSYMTGEDTFRQSEWGEHAGDFYTGRKWLTVVFECKDNICTGPLANWIARLQAYLQFFPGKKIPQPSRSRKSFPRIHQILKDGFFFFWSLFLGYFFWKKKKKNQSYKKNLSGYVHFKVLRATNNIARARVFLLLTCES